MIDYLVNILPDLTEQSPSETEAIKLLQKSEESGVKTLIAAPIFRLHQDTILPTDIRERVSHLNDVAKDEKLAIRVVPGQSIQLDDDLSSAYERGDLLTLNDTQYMLITLGGERLHPRISEILYNLQLKGVKPILAHPERYQYFAANKRFYEELRTTGSYFQVNLLSLTGYYGKISQELAQYLVKSQFVDLLGTDLHHDRHLSALRSSPTITDTIKSIMDKGSILNPEIL